MSVYDAVIVGSGFGGSINALRLSASGKSVLILERGKRYSPSDFPRDVRKTKSVFWRYPEKPAYKGLYQVQIFSGIGVVTASGVGGGSLVYANIHIRPDPVVFEDPRWPDTYSRSSLDPYYDRVAEMLGISPVPTSADLPKRTAYVEAAKERGWSIFDPDQAVSWEDPKEAGRRACDLRTECEFGCPIGAKNTLDFNYLAQAESFGAEMRTGSLVTYITPGNGLYQVHCTDVSSGEAFSVAGRRVVLSSGTLGTNKILFASRDTYKTLPDVSLRLGTGFSGNGDFLGSIQNTARDLVPWSGPDVTSVLNFFDEAPRFTMAAPTFNRPVMEVLASLGQRQNGLPGFAREFLWRRLDKLLYSACRWGLLSRPSALKGPNAGDPAHMTNLFAIGQDNANGQISYDREKLDIVWDFANENRDLIDRMMEKMTQVGETYGGTFAPLAGWPAFERILTVHPLGGCHVADSPAGGVVSEVGEVFGYPGLYVADGSVIPTAIGFHPVMTISAVAERIADAVVGSFD